MIGKRWKEIDQVWLSGFLILFLVSIPLGWNMYSDYHDVIDYTKIYLESLARSADERIIGSMKGIDLLLREVAEEIAESGENPSWPSKEEYLKMRIRAFPEVRTLIATDSNGLVRAATRKDVLGFDASGRDYFRHFKEKRNRDHLLILPPSITSTGSVVVFITRAITDRAGNFLGVTNVSISPKFFEDILGGILPDKGGMALLVSKEGTVISAMPNPDKFTGKSLAEGPAFKTHTLMDVDVSFHRVVTAIEGKKRFVVVRSLEYYPLLLLASKDEEYVLSDWRINSLIQGILYALVLIVTLFLSFGAKKRMNRIIEAEKNLEDLLEFKKDVIAESLVGIIVYKENGQCVLTNNAAARIIGGTEEEILKLNFLRTKTWERNGLKSTALKVLETGKPEELKLHTHTAFGKEIWSNFKLSRFINNSEKHLLVFFDDITAAQKAEQELIQERETAKRYLDTAGAILLVISSDLTVKLINKRGLEILGYEENEVIGRNWFDNFIPFQIRDDVSEVFSQLISGRPEGASRYENPVLTRDGRERQVLWQNRIIYGENGAIEAVLCSGEDITERVAAEQEIRKSRERLDKIVKHSPVMTGITRKSDGRFLEVSEAFIRIMGYTRAEVLGSTPEELNIWVDLGKRSELLNKYHLTGLVKDEEVQLRTKSREIITALYSLIEVELDGEECILAFAVDITDFKRLRREQEIFFNVAIDMICIATMDGYFKQLSPSWRETLGWSDEELLAAPYISFVHPDDVEKTLDAAGNMVFGSNVLSFENRYRCKDGSYRWLSWKSHVNLELKLVFAMARDITEQKNVETQLIEARLQAEAATRAKSEFLANMSHEIRTPMNAIIGLLHLLYQTGLSGKQKDYLSKVELSSKTLLGIINDILDFSKIEAGKLTIEQTEFNLDEVLSNIRNMVVMRAEEKGLEFYFRIEPDLQHNLVGDPLRLSQVLLNLTGNALKFTPRGEIILSVERVSEKNDSLVLRFTVRDTGIGIPENQMKNLFKSFSQADGSTTRRFGGTGLGLAISRTLVELMGGTIEVESVHGQGSSFFFTLPFGIMRATETGISPQALAEKKLKILVVDDSQTSREILEEMLKSMSFEVFSAGSGTQAVEMLEKTCSLDSTAFDLVILDWKMPEMDGIETARRIRNCPSLSRIPTIIMVTAFGRDEARKASADLKLAAYLDKPITGSVLYNTIQDIFVGPSNKGLEHSPVLHDEFRVFRGMPILAVEDNEINRQVISEILGQAGFRVDMAENGKEAVDKVSAHEYVAVLMDVQMPEMDGLEATARIRQAGFDRLPIIAMTAHAFENERRQCLEAGMSDHVAKPINPEILFKVLLKWIKPELFAASAESFVSVRNPYPRDISRETPQTLNSASALNRLGGNRQLLVRLLRKMGDELTVLPEMIKSCIEGNDVNKALELLHTLKGESANLALERLYVETASFERALRLEERIDAGGYVARLEALVPETLRAIGRFTETSAEETVPSERAIDRAELDTELTELERDISGHKMSARSRLQRMRETLVSLGLSEMAAALEAELAGLNFRDARQTIAALRGKLESK